MAVAETMVLEAQWSSMVGFNAVRAGVHSYKGSEANTVMQTTSPTVTSDEWWHSKGGGGDVERRLTDDGEGSTG